MTDATFVGLLFACVSALWVLAYCLIWGGDS